MEEFSKKYYRIKDVADFIDVPQSTIRFWEKEFPQAAPMRSKGNVRYYTPENIRQLRIIKYLLKDRGMKIEAARQQLSGNAANISRRMEIIEKLEGVRSELQGLLDALKKRK